MVKKILFIYLTINFLSLFYSLFIRETLYDNATELGWPYLYYQKFKLSGEQDFNWGWHFYHLFLNQSLYLAVSIFVFLIFQKKQTK